MWRRISHAARVLLYFGFPTATTLIGIYLTYRATQLDGSMGTRAYAIGIGLLLGSWAWTASRSARHRAESEARFETIIQGLARRVRDLEKHREQVQLVLDTHTATAVVLEAVESPPENAPPWAHQHRQDASAAPVIRMDPPGR